MKRWTTATLLLAVCLPVSTGACGSDSRPAATASPAASAPGTEAWDRLLAMAAPGQWRGQGEETVEVWVCRVPAGSTAAEYGQLPLRLDLTAGAVAAAVAPLTAYFDQLSLGAYRPMFMAGGEVDLGPADGPSACVDAVLAAAQGSSAEVVLAVANAEHAEGVSGGMGSGGDPCPSAPPCPAAQSRRYAYVGGNDFHPDWGANPPLDLVAHELGHTVGLVHSGYDPVAAQPYLSGLDVMSNSAAAREVQPERRDAPGTLAVQRLIAGWMAAEDAVWVADAAAGGEIVLAPSSAVDGTRLLLLADGDAVLTIEVLTADGLDAHLPHDGVAVHRVTVSGADVEIEPLVGVPADGLVQPGEQATTAGWRITVGDGWHLTIEAVAA